jgi:hypothetical protein
MVARNDGTEFIEWIEWIECIELIDPWCWCLCVDRELVGEAITAGTVSGGVGKAGIASIVWMAESSESPE